MLDALILKYLTKKGKIAYFVGQVLLIAVFAFYVFGIEGASIDEAENSFYLGMFIIVVVWAGFCFLVWRKPKEEVDVNSNEVKK